MRRVFLTLILICLGAAPAAADVMAVAASARDGGARLTIRLDAAQPFKAFALHNPARIVVDLPKAQWRSKAFAGPEAGVTRLRHGQFRPGVYRLVFDLSEAGDIQSAAIAETPWGHDLQIDLVIGEAAVAAAPAQPAKAPSPPKRPAVNAPSSLAAFDATDAAATTSSAPLPPRRPSVRTVVLDAGHGGVDPGATGKGGVIEKRVVLAVVRDVKRRLEKHAGYRVVLTRDRDIFLRLRERVRRGRAAEADLFISIHADSHPNPRVSGASLYTLSETASDAEAARLARAENKADLIGGAPLDDGPKEVFNILLDLAQRETQNKSTTAADDLLFALATNQPLLTRPKRSAGFAVLKAPDVPSVLIELGFLSNRSDAKRLNDPEGRARIAGAIAEGVFRYFDGANTARAQKRAQANAGGADRTDVRVQ